MPFSPSLQKWLNWVCSPKIWVMFRSVMRIHEQFSDFFSFSKILIFWELKRKSSDTTSGTHRLLNAFGTVQRLLVHWLSQPRGGELFRKPVVPAGGERQFPSMYLVLRDISTKFYFDFDDEFSWDVSANSKEKILKNKYSEENLVTFLSKFLYWLFPN